MVPFSIDTKVLHSGIVLKPKLWYRDEIHVFSNDCWPQLLAPLEIIVSKISLKNIPIHIV